MKTSELTGAGLALWVVWAQGICLHDGEHRRECGNWGTDYFCVKCGKDAHAGHTVTTYKPHEDWAQGGPLIERERIQLEPLIGAGWAARWLDMSTSHGSTFASRSGEGPTPLIAAMRALVASVYGDTVPDEVPA